MSIRSLGGSKLFIAAIIVASLLISTVSPAFAVHNRLRQGYYPTSDPYYYYYYYGIPVDAW